MEKETIFQRPKTFVDTMFAEMAQDTGGAINVLGSWAQGRLEALEPIIRQDISRILEMLGLRARKFRQVPLRRSMPKVFPRAA